MKTKIVSGIITLVVISLLVISGPADAYSIGLTLAKNEVQQGQAASFSAKFQIETGEAFDIEYLVLTLKGPQMIDCKFSVDGEKISGCDGISINQTSSINRTKIPTGYGYGYGYGYGDFEKGILSYDIKWDTTSVSLGTYTTTISVVTDNHKINKRGRNIKVVEGLPALRGCSIRAEGGSLIINGTDFGKASLNFNIPLGNAVNGKGMVSAQKGNNRFSYNFDIKEVTSNTPESAAIDVTGLYRIGLLKQVQENATINIDKTNKLISITDGVTIANNLEITFASKSCGF